MAKSEETSEDIAKKVSAPSLGNFNKDQKKTPEDTRSVLATIYVLGFLIIIVGVLILSFIKGFETSSVKDLLVTASGILSGPLGFIIGYYFKAQEK